MEHDGVECTQKTAMNHWQRELSTSAEMGVFAGQSIPTTSVLSGLVLHARTHAFCESDIRLHLFTVY